MRKFFAQNIDRRGRIARAIWGVVCIIIAVFLVRYSWWAFGVMIAAGVFAFYEAFRGWCLMRACGIKTKL
jgi:hypothetical protein